MSFFKKLVVFIFICSSVLINAKEVSELDTLQISFSHPHGFYENIFDLTITAESEIDSIAYTYDCSDPSIASNRIIAELPHIIKIDPNGDQAPLNID